LLSDVSHYDGLSIWGPVSPARLDEVLALITPPRGGRALDLGCGRAEVLLRLARAHDLRVVGVDKSTAALAQAEASFVADAPHAERRWVAGEVSAFAPDDAPFDVVCWLGGPVLGSDFRSTVATLSSWVAPGGAMLLGHGFWEREPPPAYLQATGLRREALGEHADTIDVGRDAGLVFLYTSVSSRSEWDVFEGRILYNVERFALAHPGEDHRDLCVKKRAWNDAQQRWGRGTMGFALYLFHRPRRH